MVNLSSNNSNNINLSGQTQRNINISTPNTNNVDANTMGNSQRARSWAIGEGLIDGEDYSAKYYANQSKTEAENLLNNPEFINVSENITIINAVGEDLDNINTLAENINNYHNLLLYEEIE